MLVSAPCEYYSNVETECDSGLKLPVGVFEGNIATVQYWSLVIHCSYSEGKLPVTTAPPATTASTNGTVPTITHTHTHTHIHTHTQWKLS